ncbi:otoferlin, partial [Eurytemora carolleeae]|uniref:otoferlin n=1 Tax=Eurytemora carolleeae TaxID=1294199 RepID=UPI000C75D207
MKALKKIKRGVSPRRKKDDHEHENLGFQFEPELRERFEEYEDEEKEGKNEDEDEDRNEQDERDEQELLQKRNRTEQRSDSIFCIQVVYSINCVQVVYSKVCVQVGDTKKYTSVKESTNCPYYNEYFVFDFHMAPVMLFDKIITLTVMSDRKFLRQGTCIGHFKLDVRTVHDAQDHQFYHKWALLTDPDDTTGGPKGYLKCDISIITKGDAVKIPTKSERDEDDIEGNLLLPVGVRSERQRAKFIIRIYRADGLPRMNSSLVANLKHAFGAPPRDLVDPYVQVSFAGLSGRTSVKKNTYSPVWNEQIVFTEMFPPLCQRIKIQLRESDTVGDTVIATHFIDLSTISNDKDKGFLPTFGPGFINLYGSTRDYSLIDENSTLNDGIGEGVAYRGRLLIAIKTEISDSIDTAPSEVEVEPTHTINEESSDYLRQFEAVYNRREEFFLFSTILEATIIDKRLVDKSIWFEISMGNAGNALDGEIIPGRVDDLDTNHHDDEREDVLRATWNSTTPPTRALSHDRLYYFLPFWDEKPSLYVRTALPDHRRRMYISNVIGKIADKLEENLHEVHLSIDAEHDSAEYKLKDAFDQLYQGCNGFLSLCKTPNTGVSSTGKTRLDKERIALCQSELETIGGQARQWKLGVKKGTIKEKYKGALGFLDRLKKLVEDPQHSLPDVFIWMISGNRRVAYQRIPARNILYSLLDEEKGADCGTVQNLFLRVNPHSSSWKKTSLSSFSPGLDPSTWLAGRRGSGSGGWVIQAKIQIYLWLGLLKHKKCYPSGLPPGFHLTNEILNAEKPALLPPLYIQYSEKHYFQMRANVYQARSLIGSDNSGLSDPFARIIIGEHCRSTQVIDETLSPTWDELLLFPEILVYGRREDIKQNPPQVIIEIYDQDKVGKAEFLGRSIAKPHIHLAEEVEYRPPNLEWCQILRGTEEAGELLAAFELFEISDATNMLPSLPQPKDGPGQATQTGQDMGPILPVPPEIRPTLVKYRFEVLFWGLRDLKRVQFLAVDKPRVDVECGGHVIQSSLILNAKKNPNFSMMVKHIDIELPEQELYCPPLTIRVVDCRSFGRFTLVGTHTSNSIHKFLFTPTPKRPSIDKSQLSIRTQYRDFNLLNGQQNGQSNFNNELLSPMESVNPRENHTILDYGTYLQSTPLSPKKDGGDHSGDIQDEDEESMDWWTKYFASIDSLIEEGKAKHYGEGLAETKLTEEHEDKAKKKSSISALKHVADVAKTWGKFSPRHQTRPEKSKVALLKVFPNELETQSEYEGFSEWLQTFDLYRGKKSEEELEEENRVVGKFKGSIKIYKLPIPRDVFDNALMGGDPQTGFFQGLPSNEPIRVLVRVYIVKAKDLHPMDINGKADPYLVLQLGSKRVSDKENYISKQLNPVFGKCFEIEASFPQDSMLSVQLYDWDLLGSDDLIGETRLDLENRFYSRHRATCGLATKYDPCGYNKWRDPMKPSQILTKLCKEGKIDGPHFSYNR